MTSNKYVALKDKTFANIFWRLGSASFDERKKAAIDLGKNVKLDDGPAEGDDAAKSQNLLQYTLERLSKGLAGSKPEAKLGFSLALTLLLEKLHKRQVRSAFETAQSCLFEMVAETKQEGSSKKVGVCFLQLSLARSGAFGKLRESQKSALVDQIMRLLEDTALVDLAALSLSSAVEQLSEEEFVPCLFDKLSLILSCGWNSLDANRLLLLLKCHRYHKEAVGRSYIKSHYATKHLISEEHFDHYLRICWASSENRETMSSAQLHPGIVQLLNCLLEKSAILLARFVAAAVAAVAASADAPVGRKAVAFNLIGWVADCPKEKFDSMAGEGGRAKADCLSECLANPEVCRQLRLHAASRTSALNAFACRLLGKQILAATPSPSEAVFLVVAKRLLEADCLFDAGLPEDCRVLQGQRMQRLPVEMLDQCAVQIEELLSAAPADPDDTEVLAPRRVTFAVQTLRQLASSRAVLNERPKASARMLLCLADRFLADDDRSSSSAAVVARAAFCRALDSMSAISEQAAYRRCLRLLAKGLAHRLDGKDSATAARQCLLRGVELMTDAVDDEKVVKRRTDKKEGSLEWCFAMAFVHLGVHLLPGGNDSKEGSADPDAEALIADLDECRRRSVEDGVLDGGADGKPRWADVLLDSFLGLLASSSIGGSRLLRSIAGLVARQVAPMVSLEGVAALNQSLLDTGYEMGGNAVEEEEDEEGDEVMIDENGNDHSDKESELSIGDESSDSSSDTDSIDPEFRRVCKAALGEASCPSDVEDADPSDLSDSAMERVDEALSLAFRSQLGPRSGGGRHNAATRAAALERRRRQCQARLRSLDVVGALLDGGARPECRRALAACLGRLALLAAGAGAAGEGSGGGGGGGGFWAAAPAGEREQLRTRAIALLKRAAALSSHQSAEARAGSHQDDDDAEIGRTAEAALAANLRTPLPAKIAETVSETVLALLRLHPASLESRLSAALSAQLGHKQRPRVGGLALWQRVLAERPQLLHSGGDSSATAAAGIAERMLELLQLPAEGIRAFDRAAVASLAACLVKGSGGVGLNGDFCRRLSEWAFARLETELAAVSSAILLEALLSLTAALLGLRQRKLSIQKQDQSDDEASLPPPPPPGLADRLKSLRPGCHNRDLRRGLQACLTALAASPNAQDQAAKRQKRQAKLEKRRETKKRLRLAETTPNGGGETVETMETD